MIPTNRFKKIVIKYGNSKVVKVSEFNEGDEVLVLSQEEMNFLLKENKD